MPKLLPSRLNQWALETAATEATPVIFRSITITLLFCHVQTPLRENFCLCNSRRIRKKSLFLVTLKYRRRTIVEAPIFYGGSFLKRNYFQRWKGCNCRLSTATKSFFFPLARWNKNLCAELREMLFKLPKALLEKFLLVCFSKC